MIEENGTNGESVDPCHGYKSYLDLSPAVSQASLVTSLIVEYFIMRGSKVESRHKKRTINSL